MKREIVALLMLSAVFMAPPVFADAKKYQPRTRLTPPVLMYHDVMDIQPDTDYTHQIIAIRPQHLEEQFKYLSDNQFNTLFVSEFAAGLRAHEQFPRNTVVITFDDGMEDVYDIVMPLIQKYHIKITAFVNPGFNGTNGRMTLAQIRELYGTGLVEIGAHTMNHVHLTQIPQEDMVREIKDSKRVLEEILGVPVTSFAYPFGEADKRVGEWVVDAGFTAAVAADDRYGRNYENMFLLPRITIGERVSMNLFVKIVRGR